MHESFLTVHKRGEFVVVAGEDGGGEFLAAGHDDGAVVDGQILDAGDTVAREGLGAELGEGGVVGVVGIAKGARIGGEAGVELAGRRERIGGGGEGGGGTRDDDALSDPAGDEDGEGAGGGGQAGGNPEGERDPAGGVQRGGEGAEREAGQRRGTQDRERGERGESEKRRGGGEQAEGFSKEQSARGDALREEQAKAAGLAVLGDEAMTEDYHEERQEQLNDEGGREFAETEGGRERTGLGEVGGVLAVGFEVLDAAGEALDAGIVGGEGSDGFERKGAVVRDAMRVAVGLALPLRTHELLKRLLLHALADLTHAVERTCSDHERGE